VFVWRQCVPQLNVHGNTILCCLRWKQRCI
jgi:hypothetical protein